MGVPQKKMSDDIARLARRSETEIVEKFKKLLRDHEEDWIIWERWFNSTLKETNHEVKELQKACDIQLATAYKYTKQPPKDRYKLILIGMFFYESDLEKVNQMLKQKAFVGELYNKNKEDFIWRFLFIKYENKWPGIECIKDEFKACKDEMEKQINDDSSKENVPTVDITADMEKKIRFEGENKFENILKDHVHQFKNAYTDLIALIQEYDKKKAPQKGSRLRRLSKFCFTNRIYRDEIAAYRQFYRWIYEDLAKKKKITRPIILSFAIHMGLNQEECDQLLDAGHFSQLYAPNLIDATVILVLQAQQSKDEYIEDKGEFNTTLADTLLQKLKSLGIQQHEIKKFSSFISGVDKDAG